MAKHTYARAHIVRRSVSFSLIVIHLSINYYISFSCITCHTQVIQQPYIHIPIYRLRSTIYIVARWIGEWATGCVNWLSKSTPQYIVHWAVVAAMIFGTTESSYTPSQLRFCSHIMVIHISNLLERTARAPAHEQKTNAAIHRNQFDKNTLERVCAGARGREIWRSIFLKLQVQQSIESVHRKHPIGVNMKYTTETVR